MFFLHLRFEKIHLEIPVLSHQIVGTVEMGNLARLYLVYTGVLVGGRV